MWDRHYYIYCTLYSKNIYTDSKYMDLSLKDIQKAAGWSVDSTFRKYYNLPALKNFELEIANRFKNNWETWTYVELLFIPVYYIFWHSKKDQYWPILRITKN